MLFDLSKLRGEREHIERTVPPAAFGPPDPEYRVAAPVALSLDVQRAGGEAFTVSGRIETRLELACSRCLEPFEAPVDTTFELRYVPVAQNVGQDEQEVAEDDLTTAYYREGMLDLIDLMREQFVLALPMKPLCSDACRGLCPVCGINLNRSQCGCSPSWEDPRLAPLKSLLAREKES